MVSEGNQNKVKCSDPFDDLIPDEQFFVLVNKYSILRSLIYADAAVSVLSALSSKILKLVLYKISLTPEEL